MNSGDRAVGLLVLINSPGRILQEGHIALTSAFFSSRLLQIPLPTSESPCPIPVFPASTARLATEKEASLSGSPGAKGPQQAGTLHLGALGSWFLPQCLQTQHYVSSSRGPTEPD